MAKQKLANTETTATDVIKILLEWRHAVLLHVSANAHGIRFVANLANALRLLYRPQSKQPFQLRFSTRNFVYEGVLLEFHEKQKVAVVQMHNNGFRAPSLMVKNEPIGQPCNTCTKYQSLFSNFVAQEDYNDYESFTCDLNITKDGLTVSETKNMLVKHLKRYHSMPNGTMNASIWQFICAFYFADRCEKCRNVLFFFPIGRKEGGFLDACVTKVINSDVTAIATVGARCLDLEFKRKDAQFFNTKEIIESTALLENEPKFQKWKKSPKDIALFELAAENNDGEGIPSKGRNRRIGAFAGENEVREVDEIVENQDDPVSEQIEEAPEAVDEPEVVEEQTGQVLAANVWHENGRNRMIGAFAGVNEVREVDETVENQDNPVPEQIEEAPEAVEDPEVVAEEEERREAILPANVWHVPIMRCYLCGAVSEDPTPDEGSSLRTVICAHHSLINWLTVFPIGPQREPAN